MHTACTAPQQSWNSQRAAHALAAFPGAFWLLGEAPALRVI